MKAVALKTFRDKLTEAVYVPGEVLTLERTRFSEIREKLGNSYIAEIVDSEAAPEPKEPDSSSAPEPEEPDSGSAPEPEEPGNGSTPEPEGPVLSGLTIGSLSLIPAFDPGVTRYTAKTTNNTNKVRAVAADDTAVILVSINGEAVPNDASAAWSEGENTLTVSIAADGGGHTNYTVIVTKE